MIVDDQGKADGVPLLALGLEGEGDEGLVGEPRGIRFQAEAPLLRASFSRGSLSVLRLR